MAKNLANLILQRNTKEEKKYKWMSTYENLSMYTYYGKPIIQWIEKVIMYKIQS